MRSPEVANEKHQNALERETERNLLGEDSEGSSPRQALDITQTDTRSERRSEQIQTTSSASRNRKRKFPLAFSRRHPYATILGAFALLVAIAAGVFWWRNVAISYRPTTRSSMHGR